MMLAMIRDLFQHKNYANTILLNAVMGNEQASADRELRRLLHHVILANRFWLSLFLDQPFDIDRESQIPHSMRDIQTLYRQTHDQELDWIRGIGECDLERALTTPAIPDRTFSLAEAAMQVCLHSHGHRSQCATRLRALGSEPPPMDFILWLKDRARAEWSQTQLRFTPADLALGPL